MEYWRRPAALDRAVTAEAASCLPTVARPDVGPAGFPLPPSPAQASAEEPVGSSAKRRRTTTDSDVGEGGGRAALWPIVGEQQRKRRQRPEDGDGTRRTAAKRRRGPPERRKRPRHDGDEGEGDDGLLEQRDGKRRCTGEKPTATGQGEHDKRKRMRDEEGATEEGQARSGGRPEVKRARETCMSTAEDPQFNAWNYWKITIDPSVLPDLDPDDGGKDTDDMHLERT